MGASERRSKGAALMARRIARAAVLALVYIALTKLGLKFAQLTPSSTVVWPGTGVAVVGTLLFGYETVPVWVIAAFFTNITTSGSLAPSLLIALGNGLEALAGAWLIRRYAGGVSAFDGPRSTFYAIGCLAAAAAVSATLGIVALHPWQLIAVGRLPWLIWWWGDLTGAVLIVPCFLSWAEWDRHLPATRPALEICALWLILLVLGALVFVRTETYSLTFLIIFLLAWAALRLGRRVTTTSILALDCFASVMTVHGLGPFTHGGRGTALVVMQLFFGSLAVTKLLIANTVEQRQKAIVIPIHVEDSAWLPLQAKLCPGKNLAKLFERAVPTRQGDERIGKIGHQSLAFMHRLNDPQIREPAVRHFLFDHGPRNNADNVSACRQRRIRQYTH